MDEQLRILLVEDSEDDALLLIREIKKGGYELTVMRVETGEAMVRCLNEQTWDIVISDYRLPKFSALEALKVLQESELDLPFIIISGKVDDEVAIDALTADAHDFIRKDNLVRLIPAIKRELDEAIGRAEHKKVVIALKESEEKYSSLFKNNHSVMLLIDPQTGNIVDANPSACAFYGYSQTELIQKKIQDINLLSDEKIQQELNKAKLEQRNHFFFRHHLASGEVRDVEVYSAPITVQGKSLLYSIIHDITEHKTAEEALKISERRLLRAQEVTHVGDWELDVETDRTMWSDELYRIYGFEPVDELKLETMIARVHPDDRDHVNEAFTGWIENGKGEPFEYRVLRPDGSIRYVYSPTEAVCDSTGKVVKLYGVVLDITERKKAEDTLRLHSEMLENMGEGVSLIRISDGIIVHTNPRFEEMFGYEHGEMIGQNVNIINAPTDISPEETVGVLMKLLLKEGAWHGDVQNIKKDGTPFWCHVNVSVFEHSEYGQVLVSVHEDITERKQTERNQIILAEILGNLNDPGSLTAAINNIITIIKRDMGIDAVGIRLQDGDDFPYFVHDGFSNDFLISENTLLIRDENGEISRDLNGNVSLGCTCGLVISGKTDPANSLFTPCGSFWTNDSIPLLDLPAGDDPRLQPRNRCIHDGFCSIALIPIRANQKIVGLLQFNDREKDCFTLEMIHFFEQISSSIGVALMRKQFVGMLEKHTLELELNKKRLNALLVLTHMADNNLEEITTFVLDECIKLTNSEFGFIGFMNEDESILTNTAWTKNILDICSVADNPLIFPVVGAGIWVEPLLQRKSIIINDYESSKYHKNGIPEGHIPLSRLINVPLFEGDKIVALAIIANKKEEYDETDVHQLTLLLEGMWAIVQRKRAEEEIRTLNSELEQRVKDRTVELDQKNKELIRLDKIKNEFMDTINHELRTPLTSIIGYSKLLLDGVQGEMTEKQTKYIERIWTRGNHQLQLVNDLLDFSKLESDNLNFISKLVSVTIAINEVAQDVIPLLKQKGQKINLEIADDIAKVYVDEMRFEQILLNLVNNAIKFTPDNGKITIKADNVDKMVKISVIDNGIGIKEEDIEKLFHKFVQVDQSNSRSFGGTGLGLTIVKKLTELMGGYIEVESEYGNGSTFSIFLLQKKSENHTAAL